MAKKKHYQGEFCWPELVCHDTEHAKAFYTSLFNWQTKTIELKHGTYTVFKTADAAKDIGGMLQCDAEQPAHWLNYVCVDDLEEILKKALQLGANIKQAITTVGEYGRFAIIVDPSGAEIALWQVEKSC